MSCSDFHWAKFDFEVNTHANVLSVPCGMVVELDYKFFLWQFNPFVESRIGLIEVG